MSDCSIMIIDIEALEIVVKITMPFVKRKGFVKDTLFVNSKKLYVSGDCGMIMIWDLNDRRKFEGLQNDNQTFSKKDGIDEIEFEDSKMRIVQRNFLCLFIFVNSGFWKNKSHF